LNQHLARMLKVASLLNISRNAVSKHLKAIRKIQKKGQWIPHESSELAIQNYNTCLSLFSRHKKKQFLYQVVTGIEKWIYYDNSKRKEL